MGAITPEFMFDLESNMRVIASQQYQRLARKLWWNKVAKRSPTGAKKERLIWLLDTAKIERPNAKSHGGQAIFEEILSQSMEIEVEHAVAGLELNSDQLKDTDGNGVDLAAHWARQVGQYSAYWPQKALATAIKANPTGYDGVAFFHASHPVNPFNSSAGVFANLFTGGASGAYPGAVPIDISVTVDVALQNLAKAVAYVSSIPMPNGEDPRMLRVVGILVPPALTARAVELTNAKFIAQAASAGGGSADVEAVVQLLGLGTPIEVPELGANFGGSDTDYYLLVEEITSDELGAFVYVEREAFEVIFHGPLTDAQLARMKKFQWTIEGRNAVAAGHPFLLFKCRKT